MRRKREKNGEVVGSKELIESPRRQLIHSLDQPLFTGIYSLLISLQRRGGNKYSYGVC